MDSADEMPVRTLQSFALHNLTALFRIFLHEDVLMVHQRASLSTWNEPIWRISWSRQAIGQQSLSVVLALPDMLRQNSSHGRLCEPGIANAISLISGHPSGFGGPYSLFPRPICSKTNIVGYAIHKCQVFSAARARFRFVMRFVCPTRKSENNKKQILCLTPSSEVAQTSCIVRVIRAQPLRSQSCTCYPFPFSPRIPFALRVFT
jgi:hypothetical protein